MFIQFFFNFLEPVEEIYMLLSKVRNQSFFFWLKNFSYFAFAGSAVPCRISFKSGKEHHFCFLAISLGTFGWLVLAEELPSQKSHGVVRAVAPLAGCNVCIVIH